MAPSRREREEALNRDGLEETVERYTGHNLSTFFRRFYATWNNEAEIQEGNITLYDETVQFLTRADKNGEVAALSNSTTPATLNKFDAVATTMGKNLFPIISYLHGEYDAASKPDITMGLMAFSALENKSGHLWENTVDIYVIGDSQYDYDFGVNLGEHFDGGTGVDVYQCLLQRDKQQVLPMEEFYERREEHSQ